MSVPPAAGSPVRRVRFRLLPWRLRRRVKGMDDDVSGVGELAGLGDDPISAVIGLVVFAFLLLAVLVPFVLGLVLLPFELALIAVVVLGELLLRAVRLRPWTLAVEERLGDRWIPVERHQVKGLTAARRRRGELRSRLG